MRISSRGLQAGSEGTEAATHFAMARGRSVGPARGEGSGAAKEAHEAAEARFSIEAGLLGRIADPYAHMVKLS